MLNEVPGKIGLDFDLTQLGFGIFGFLLVIMMVLRPQGLIPEKRHQAEFAEGSTDGAGTDRGDARMSTPEAQAEQDRLNAGPAILETPYLTKIFGGLTAVDGVSFRVPEKSIVSIIGPNGAGKTTFFNMLTGLYKPSLGNVIFDGKDVTTKRPDQITALGVARTFQNIRLFGTMSAVENVLVGQHARMKATRVRLDPPHAARAARGARGAREGARAARLRRRRRAPRTTMRRPTSPTATSAAWRSPARSPRTRSCCCSTSRRPA